MDAMENLKELTEEQLKKLAEEGNEEAIEILCEEFDYSLEDFALKCGCQWAFDQMQDGENIWSYIGDEDHAIWFLLWCMDNGIYIGSYEDVLEEMLRNGHMPQGFLNALSEGCISAIEMLSEQELQSYEWTKDHLQGRDDVAEIVALHLEKTFQYKEDFKWLKGMADDKVPQAQYLLGLLYLGEVPGIVNENKTLALRYIKAAKVGGCKLADAKLEELDAKEQEARARAIQEKQKQEQRKQKAAEEATRMKQKAAEEAAMMKQRILSAEKEELTAEETLELAYYLGTGHMSKGIKKNANKATKLFRIAAKKGSMEAECQLGMRLIEGEGCRKNWNAGMKYMRKAAQGNYTPAQEYIEDHDTSFNRLIHKFFK